MTNEHTTIEIHTYRRITTQPYANPANREICG